MTGQIPRVLSTFLEHKVRALLMGGQACIIYGAAEFSRDIDFAVLVSAESLNNLRQALAKLEAEEIFVPALSEEALLKGHACHFRCRAEEVKDLRIDIMSVMRNAAAFPELWERRTEIELAGIGRVPVMSLEDLISVKKTQRDKDWYMIRRLIEADIYKFSGDASREKIFFWLMECRTPELLISLTEKEPEMAREAVSGRALLDAAIRGDMAETAGLLKAEEDKEKELDRLHWLPLKAELEKWRHEKRSI